MVRTLTTNADYFIWTMTSVLRALGYTRPAIFTRRIFAWILQQKTNTNAVTSNVRTRDKKHNNCNYT